MKENFTVIGGLYRETSSQSDLFLGSGGRAALFLATQDTDIKFITSATDYACKSFHCNKKGLTSGTGKITIDNYKVDSDISFKYSSYLFDPLIIGVIENKKLKTKKVCVDNCLYFGMLNADINIRATNKVVYDPQNTSNPKKFSEIGSTTGKLAIVLNEHEAKAMVGEHKTEELIQKVKEQNNADIVVLKRGPYGALVLDNEKITDIPLFLSKKFHKIGSGDIFSACFAHCWIIQKLDPIESAIIASKVVSSYVEKGYFENIFSVLEKSFNELDSKKITKTIYLAGPFFSVAELWLVEKLKSIFELYGVKVFSPYHDIGISNNDLEIATADLELLQKADTVFAIANNFDPGTVFEIGYAKALNKNVFMYLCYSAEKDIAMFNGTGCFISNEIDDLIYKAIWNQ